MTTLKRNWHGQESWPFGASQVEAIAKATALAVCMAEERTGEGRETHERQLKRQQRNQANDVRRTLRAAAGGRPFKQEWECSACYTRNYLERTTCRKCGRQESELREEAGRPDGATPQQPPHACQPRTRTQATATVVATAMANHSQSHGHNTSQPTQ